MSLEDIPLLHIHIKKSDVPFYEPVKRPKETRVSHRTIVLTAASPAQNVAGYDPGRREVYMNVLDNPIVLSGSTGMASDPASISATLATPNGRILAVSNGSEYCIKGPDELWVSAGVYPTRVGVSIVREIN